MADERTINTQEKEATGMDKPSGDDILRQIAENKEEFARRFSVTRIALFGSFARGTCG